MAELQLSVGPMSGKRSNMQITGIFTVASIARGYLVRRAFVRLSLRWGAR